MKLVRTVLGVILISLFAIGCGSSGGGDNGGDATGNTDTSNTDTSTTSIPDLSSRPITMTAEERVAAMSEISEFRKSLPGNNPYADNEALLEYLLTRDDIEDADYGIDLTVWARFTDGLPIVFINNRPNSNSVTPLYPEQAYNNVSASGYTYELPGADNAYVIDVENLGRDATGHVIGYLTNKKYNVTGIEGTVEQLRAIKDASVIYFSTHGDIGRDKYGKSRYVLGTSTSFDGSDRPSQGGDLDKDDPTSWDEYLRGLLVMVQYEEGSGVGYWGITDEFIYTHWSLSKDALVFIDACNSGSDVPDMKTLRDILQNMNMRTFVGWDNLILPSHSADAGRYFFDRVLGANDYLKEDPPQRPFNARAVYYDMRARSLFNKSGRTKYISYADTDDDGTKEEITTHLRVLPADVDTSILVPSIKKITVDEIQKTLTLHGEFGSTEGEVTIGEQKNKLPISSWADDEIILQSKDASGYFSGEVMVSVRDHESNKVPITGWENVSMTYTSDLTESFGPGFEQKVECNMHFRADVHPYREEPGLAPIVPNSVFYNVAPHSTCTVSMKGENDSMKLYLPDTGPDAGVMTWVGNEDAAGIPKYFYMRGHIDAANYKLNILLGLGAKAEMLYKDSNESFPFMLITDTALLGICAGTGEGFDLEMDNSFHVAPDRNTGSMPNFATTLEWGDINADPIPKEGVTPSITNTITINKMERLRY